MKMKVTEDGTPVLGERRKKGDEIEMTDRQRAAHTGGGIESADDSESGSASKRSSKSTKDE